jgi:hypothetical protein
VPGPTCSRRRRAPRRPTPRLLAVDPVATAAQPRNLAQLQRRTEQQACEFLDQVFGKLNVPEDFDKAIQQERAANPSDRRAVLDDAFYDLASQESGPVDAIADASSSARPRSASPPRSRAGDSNSRKLLRLPPGPRAGSRAGKLRRWAGKRNPDSGPRSTSRWRAPKVALPCGNSSLSEPEPSGPKQAVSEAQIGTLVLKMPVDDKRKFFRAASSRSRWTDTAAARGASGQ